MIVNPVAGGAHQARLERTLGELTGLGVALDVRRTGGRGDALALAAAVPKGVDAVVAAGGDGTIGEVVNGLMTTGRKVVGGASERPAFGIIPLGTANVAAIEAGIPRAPAAVARVIADGNAARIGLGRANGRYFVQMAGVGFDAAVVAAVDPAFKLRLNRWGLGKLAYVAAMAGAIRQGFDRRYSVEIDGAIFDAATVIVANGRFYAGKFVLAPDARTHDPGLWLVLFGQGRRRDVVRYLLALGLGRLVRQKDVRAISTSAARISGAAAETVQLDGDPAEVLPLAVEAVPNALDLLVPRPYTNRREF